MKKFILPVVLLAVGAGIATAASFAAKQGDCCRSAKSCCAAKSACCETAAVAQDCCRSVPECCEDFGDCCGQVTGIESTEKQQ